MLSCKQIITFIMLLTLVAPKLAHAQAAAATGPTDDNVEAFMQDSKTDLLIVVAGGLAGAILGLSTLSFVDEPKKHTRNILVGASLGIIAGVGFVAFNQANRTRGMFYEDEVPVDAYRSGQDFNTLARSDWHYSEFAQHSSIIHAPAQIGYSFAY